MSDDRDTQTATMATPAPSEQPQPSDAAPSQGTQMQPPTPPMTPAGPVPGQNGVRTPMQNAVDNATAPQPTAQAEAMKDALATDPHPHASWLHDTAEVLAGGPRYTTTYDDQGNPTKHIQPVSTAHLGMALALEVLRGGLSGLSKPPGQAAEAGAEEAEKFVNKNRAAQQEQNQQDAQAQARKYAIAENNLKLHQLAINVGRADEDTNRRLDAAFAPVINDLERNHPEAIMARVPEWGLQDALKKYNVTKDMAVPYDTVPVLDPKTGKQATHADGTPVWGHMYAIVNPGLKTTLSDETQQMGYNIGQFQAGDGSQAQLGNPDWPLADIIKRHTKYAQVQVTENLLQQQIRAMHPDEEETPLNMAAQVKNDPTMLAAIEDYSKYAGVGALDQVLKDRKSVV